MFLTLVQGGSGARPLYGTTGPNPESATDSDTTLETNMYYTSSLDELTVENIDINGTATLNGSTITSWPSGGGGGSFFGAHGMGPVAPGSPTQATNTVTTGSIIMNDDAEIFFGDIGGEAELYSDGTDLLLDMSHTKLFKIRNEYTSTTTGFTFDALNGDFTAIGDISAVGGTFTGDVAAVNFNSTSDESLKENVQTITNALDKVDSLRGVNFDWIDSGKAATGVIAQEIETILPEVVTEDEDGIKHVAYGNVVGVLIEAIKELKAEIEDLKK